MHLINSSDFDPYILWSSSWSQIHRTLFVLLALEDNFLFFQFPKVSNVSRKSKYLSKWNPPFLTIGSSTNPSNYLIWFLHKGYYMFTVCGWQFSKVCIFPYVSRKLQYLTKINMFSYFYTLYLSLLKILETSDIFSQSYSNISEIAVGTHETVFLTALYT